MRIETPTAPLGPTLGPVLFDWMLAHLVYGPGDISGTRLCDLPPDSEVLYWLARAYELHPPGHDLEGRRRYQRVALSLRKGSAKTEFAAWVLTAEITPTAPTRFAGWAKGGETTPWGYVYRPGEPMGAGVRDAYCPLLAYTEEQSKELAFYALTSILAEAMLAVPAMAGRYELTKEAVASLDADGRVSGRAVAISASPNAADGARTSFQALDESHRMTSPRHLEVVEVMEANLPKRRAADGWTLETTTAFAPGEDSIAERTHARVLKVLAGEEEADDLYYFHRQAGADLDLSDPDQLHRAVVEASGSAISFANVPAITKRFAGDPALSERLWTNRPVQQARQAFNMAAWDQLDAIPEFEAPKGAAVVLGFDGSRSRDATAIVGTVTDGPHAGRQWLVALWENELDDPSWGVPVAEVEAVIEAAFKRWRVVFMYADPAYWHSQMATWIARYGQTKRPRRASGNRQRQDRVQRRWDRDRWTKTVRMVQAYDSAIKAGEVRHDGNPDLRRHLANAVKARLRRADADSPWTITKDRKSSPRRIDAAVAAVLSWQAFQDAREQGLDVPRSKAIRTY